MKLKNVFTKRAAFSFILGLFVLSTFTSCHRDGCPGQITQHQTEQVPTVNS